MNYTGISNAELQKCLERSGYLLESKIVRGLTERGYFVEPNQVILDAKTGKSREIDFIAEHYRYSSGHRGTCVKTYFAAEVVNNRYPIVLLTPRPSTPNSDFESYVKFGCTPEPSPFYGDLDIYEKRSPSSENVFAQYCGITTKKGETRELMANHPDDMYGSLQKLAEYVETELESFGEWARDSAMSDIWRIFFWHPMLVVGGQLCTVAVGDGGKVEIEEADSAFLEFNWHRGEDRRTTLIEVVTVRALYDRLALIVKFDQELEAKLHQLHALAKPEANIKADH